MQTLYTAPCSLTAAATHWDLNTPLFRFRPPKEAGKQNLQQYIAARADATNDVLRHVEVQFTLNYLLMLEQLTWEYFTSVADTASDCDNPAEGAKQITRELRRLIRYDAHLNCVSGNTGMARQFARLSDRFQERYAATFRALVRGVRFEIEHLHGKGHWWEDLLSAVIQAQAVYLLYLRWKQHSDRVTRAYGVPVDRLAPTDAALRAAYGLVARLDGGRGFGCRTAENLVDELFGELRDECADRIARELTPKDPQPTTLNPEPEPAKPRRTVNINRCKRK